MTHGTSNRLHGNGSGLGNQGGMMGEGWGDFYAHVMTSKPTDPANGVYSEGGYATFMIGGNNFTANYFYGIRRFPTAVMAFTGARRTNPITRSPLGTLTQAAIPRLVRLRMQFRARSPAAPSLRPRAAVRRYTTRARSGNQHFGRSVRFTSLDAASRTARVLFFRTSPTV